MEHFIVDMQTEKSKKYYFIREEVSQEKVRQTPSREALL